MSPIELGKVFRPSPKLVRYYIVTSLLTGPGALIVLPVLLIRYATLRYQLDEQGIRMSVGVLFKSETIVAYRRIQDIHLTKGIFQRWFGIASLSVQTASGNSAPEITLEGMEDGEAIRDWLYERSRGSKTASETNDLTLQLSGEKSSLDAATVDSLLIEIRDSLKQVAVCMEQTSGSKNERGVL